MYSFPFIGLFNLFGINTFMQIFIQNIVFWFVSLINAKKETGFACINNFYIQFLLNTNEFGNIIHNNPFVMYADDTSLLVSANSDQSLEAKINSLLGSVNTWYEFNYLYFNAMKIQAIRFHNRQIVSQTKCDYKWL